MSIPSTTASSNLNANSELNLGFSPSVGPHTGVFNPQILGIVSQFISLKEGMEARAISHDFNAMLLTNHSGGRSVSIRDFGSIDRAIAVLGTLKKNWL